MRQSPPPSSSGQPLRPRRSRTHRPPARAPLPAENQAHAQVHDLHDAAAARFVAACRITPGERVWEVGAGTGALTAALVAAGAMVQAVERDPARAAALRQRVPNVNVQVGDALHAKPSFAAPWRVVANPPFNLTAALIEQWVLDPAVSAVDLLLQQQAAMKLTGYHQRQTQSSALLNLAGRSRLVARLERDDVSPPSRVDLAQWAWKRGNPSPSAAELRLVASLLAKAFAGAHTVRAALQGLATNIQLHRQGAEHRYDPNGHPRSVPAAAWLPLAKLLAMCGKLR